MDALAYTEKISAASKDIILLLQARGITARESFDVFILAQGALYSQEAATREIVTALQPE